MQTAPGAAPQRRHTSCRRRCWSPRDGHHPVRFLNADATPIGDLALNDINHAASAQ
jgi:hypothetical protein